MDSKATKTYSARYVESLKKRAARDQARANRLAFYLRRRIRPPEQREFGYYENSETPFSGRLYFENLGMAHDYPLAAHENAVDDEEFQRFIGRLGIGCTPSADSVKS